MMQHFPFNHNHARNLAFSFPVVPPTTEPPMSSAVTSLDDEYMRRCVELSLRAAGQTRPNPPVGCVIVDKQGKVLGQGYHRRAGQSHAEVNALNDVKAHNLTPRGATAYVSLEPCNHYGRTPPCSQALIEAGISRCVVGLQDPDERTSGNGIKRLRDAGVDVTVGVQGELCLSALEGFISRIEKKRPLGIFKYAMTLDGKIASETGSSQWVTGQEARRYVHHQLRARVDAIVVGGETLRKDNPSLTARHDVVLDGPFRPIRVVMTRTLDLPMDCNLWEDITEFAQTIVFAQTVGKKCDEHEQRRQIEMFDYLKGKGVEVIVNEEMNAELVTKTLYERGCLSVLWECGGGLAAHAIKSGVIDKVFAFIAPKFIGGERSPSPIRSPALDVNMEDALLLHDRKVETFDNGDILMSGYLS